MAAPRVPGLAPEPARRALEAAAALGAGLVAGLAIAKLGTTDNQLKAILVGLAAVGIGVGAFRPDFGLAMLVALVPFEFRFTAAGVYTGTNEALIVGLALILAWRIRIADVPGWARLGVFAVIAGSWLTVIVAERPGDAAWGAVRWTATLVILLSAFTVLRTEREAIRRLMVIVAGSAVVVALFAMAQRIGISAIVGEPFQQGNVDSFFGYYTAYAGYMAMAAVLVTGEIVAAWTERRGARALAFGLALVPILLGVAVSLSRGGLLALGAGWVVLVVLLARRGGLLLRAGIVLGVFAVAALIATPPAVRTGFQARFSQPVGAAYEDRTRAALQDAGHRALDSHALGLGYGNFSSYLQRTTHSRFVNQAFFHSHQLPTQVGVDSGWLGLAGFAVLALAPFVMVVRRLVRGTVSVRGAAFVAAMAGFLAQGLFDYLLYELAFLVFFCMLVFGAWYELSGPGSRPETP
jgi:O-antigen ligase